MVICLCGTGLYVVSYSTNNASAGSPITDLLPQQQGTVVIDNFKIQEFRKGAPVHEMQAEHVVYSEKENNVHVTGVLMTFNEESGVQGSMKSKEADYNTSTKLVEVKGDVKYTSQNGSELTCALLYWNMSKDQIHVPGKFFVTHKNDTLKGSNLMTNSKLEQVSINNIEGIIR